MNIVDQICKSNLQDIRDIFCTPNKIYTFLNPVSFLSARNHKELYNNFDGIFADGSILVFFIKIFYGKKIKRKSFDMTSVAPLLFNFCEKHHRSIYIVGSTPESNVKAIKGLTIKYPNILFLGGSSGFFKSEDDRIKLMSEIIDLNPDFVIVGMGVPIQEDFLFKLKKKGFSGIGFTCGGFIHQISNDQIDYYPKWVDNLNIRFIYRMYKEKHTRKRYLKAAFVFPIVFIFDRVLNDNKILNLITF